MEALLLNITHQDLIAAGFVKTETQPLFHYQREIVSKEEIEANNLEEEQVPKLLFTTSGINSGFCIYTGDNFIWLNCKTPKEAIDVASKIVSIEPLI